MNIEELKYPIGKFIKPEVITGEMLQIWISDISQFPEQLKKEVEHLKDEELDTPYRAEGWTIRQVVHHCADSHMNSMIRFKLALTEDKPVIKPYQEDRWAELEDSKHLAIESSIQLLEGLHARWSKLLSNLTDQDLKRTFIHPEHHQEVSLAENIGIYSWHGRHHLAQITTLKKRKGW